MPGLISRSSTHLTAALSLIAVSSSVAGAATLLNDSFGSGSSLNTNGTTVSSTATNYDVLSSKNATAGTYSTLAANDLKATLSGGTTGGTLQVQGQFSPVTLASAGDYVDFTYTFTGSNLLASAGDNSGLYTGLFNGGGAAPATGLSNAGLASASTGNATGNAQNWVGFAGQIRNSTTNNNALIRSITRPAQTGTTNINQDVLFGGIGSSGFATPAGVQLTTSATTAALLAVGNGTATTYTEQYRVTLNADGTETVLITLTDVTGGTTLATVSSTASAAQAVATFDSLAFGTYKNATAAANPLLDVSNILVTTKRPRRRRSRPA